MNFAGGRDARSITLAQDIALALRLHGGQATLYEICDYVRIIRECQGRHICDDFTAAVRNQCPLPGFGVIQPGPQTAALPPHRARRVLCAGGIRARGVSGRSQWLAIGCKQGQQRLMDGKLNHPAITSSGESESWPGSTAIASLL